METGGSREGCFEQKPLEKSRVQGNEGFSLAERFLGRRSLVGEATCIFSCGPGADSFLLKGLRSGL